MKLPAAVEADCTGDHHVAQADIASDASAGAGRDEYFRRHSLGDF
jgi:hypothetical protein